MTKKYSVVSIHFTNICNLNCPFCYKEKGQELMDDLTLFEYPKYLKEITDQVALGGGEPLLFPMYLRKFSRICKEEDLICNVTTNGTELDKMDDVYLKWLFKDIEMVSISFDQHKCRTQELTKHTFRRIKRLSSIGIRVGVNLLLNKVMFSKPMIFMGLIAQLYNAGAERVFALYPKNMDLGIDITKHRTTFAVLTATHTHFYVDDLTKMILEQGYDNWKRPCHYTRDIVSIDYDSKVYGCSFDSEPIMEIKKPKDILRLKRMRKQKRMSCPYLIRP